MTARFYSLNLNHTLVDVYCENIDLWPTSKDISLNWKDSCQMCGWILAVHRYHTVIECNYVLSTWLYSMLVENRAGVGLTRSTKWSFLPSSFPVKGASKWSPHGSETPIVRTGQHPWLFSGCAMAQKTFFTRRSQWEHTNVDLTS